MPRGDGTGPAGMGPRTGKGLGPCSGYTTPGYTNPGGGRGWRNRFYATGLPGWVRAGFNPAQGAPLAPEQEATALKSQAQGLRATLAQIEKRLQEIEGREE